MRHKLSIIVVIVAAFAASVFTQTTEFTYQGSLRDGAAPANGNYDFQFSLWSALAAGTQLGTTQTMPGVAVANGIFNVSLDFGASFPGAARFLQIAVQPAGGGAYTTLSPRQPITSSPHAIRSLNAANADLATNVTGVVAVANGGTGSATKNFVDLTTNQTVGGTKTFTNPVVGNGSQLTNLNGANITNNSVTAAALASDTFPNNQNLSRLGSLRWDLLGQRVTVGTAPYGVAFDGTNIWVTNNSSSNVTKIRASDGTVQGTFAVGINPHGIAFDGVNIWVANQGDATVTKLRASDGAVQGTFAVGTQPLGVAFDGTNIWVTNYLSHNVTKLRASDGAVQGTFTPGTNPWGVTFDGENIWVVISGSNNVVKLRASDGASVGSFVVGSFPGGIAFDGANIWVANQLDSSVKKVRASDGVNQGTFTVGNSPSAIAFDGANIWVTNRSSGTVTKLRASDGALQGTFAVGGTVVRAIAFDGANMWVAGDANNRVVKFPVFP